VSRVTLWDRIRTGRAMLCQISIWDAGLPLIHGNVDETADADE